MEEWKLAYFTELLTMELERRAKLREIPLTNFPSSAADCHRNSQEQGTVGRRSEEMMRQLLLRWLLKCRLLRT